MDRNIIDFILDNIHIVLVIVFLIYIFFPTKRTINTPKDMYWDIKCALTTNELLKKCDEAFMKFPNDLSFRYLRAFELFLKDDDKYRQMIIDDYTIVINNYEQYKPTSHNLPELSDVYSDRAFEYYCMAAKQNEEFYHKAIEDCNMALRLGTKKLADVYTTLANCKSELNDNNTAIELYTKALESNPEEDSKPLIYSNRAYSYRAIGNYDAAKADEEMSDMLFNKVFNKK